MKRTFLTIKKNVYLFSLLASGVFMLMWSACQKNDNSNPSPGSISEQKRVLHDNKLMTDSFYLIRDSLDSARTIQVYDDCHVLVGTLTELNHLITFTSQTSSNVTISGTSSLTLNRNVFYWFKPSGCSSGNFILKVKFSTIYPASFCNYFHLNGCSWLAVGSCNIISSYSFVNTLPVFCN